MAKLHASSNDGCSNFWLKSFGAKIFKMLCRTHFCRRMQNPWR